MTLRTAIRTLFVLAVGLPAAVLSLRFVATLLAAMDDGLDNNLDPGEPEERNIYEAMAEGKEVKKLPMSLGEALDQRTFGAAQLVVDSLTGRGRLAHRLRVKQRTQAQGAWADIDVQLKRRWDLIPNLVETAKAFLAHERGTLEAVIAARNSADAARQQAAADPGNAEAMRSLSTAEKSTLFSGTVISSSGASTCLCW